MIPSSVFWPNRWTFIVFAILAILCTVGFLQLGLIFWENSRDGDVPWYISWTEYLPLFFGMAVWLILVYVHDFLALFYGPARLSLVGFGFLLLIVAFVASYGVTVLVHMVQHLRR